MSTESDGTRAPGGSEWVQPVRRGGCREEAEGHRCWRSSVGKFSTSAQDPGDRAQRECWTDVGWVLCPPVMLGLVRPCVLIFVWANTLPAVAGSQPGSDGPLKLGNLRRVHERSIKVLAGLRGTMVQFAQAGLRGDGNCVTTRVPQGQGKDGSDTQRESLEAGQPAETRTCGQPGRGARERNTPASRSSLPPVSRWRSPLAERNRKPEGRGAHLGVHIGQQAGQGQRVGLKGQTEGITASCWDPHLQKCCATCGRGSRLGLVVPEGSDNKVYFCVSGGECVMWGVREDTSRRSNNPSSLLPQHLIALWQQSGNTPV